jgi:hypothetical protein
MCASGEKRSSMRFSLEITLEGAGGDQEIEADRLQGEVGVQLPRSVRAKNSGLCFLALL